MTKDKNTFPSEHAEQCAVATWLRGRGIAFFAVPNGAKMGPAECAKMKREGMSPGVPDLFVLDMGLRLVVEMKRRDGGVVSKDQRAWLDHLTSQGWDVMVAYGAEEAITWLRERLG
jgi:hypothetical protein